MRAGTFFAEKEMQGVRNEKLWQATAIKRRIIGAICAE